MKKSASFGCLATVLSCALSLFGQRGTGELRVTVTDPSGAGLVAHGELVSEANQVSRSFRTDRDGHYNAENLPFGVYRLSVSHPGFAPFSELLPIHSEVPMEHRVTLRIAPVETKVVVSDSATLLNPDSTGTISSVGSEALGERPLSLPRREMLDLVAMQPGWLLEANGVLHPRGAEYDAQYVLDGVPIVDNRSPTFAPDLEIEDVQSVRILTGNYPAEFGRKLGGVIELTSAQDPIPGFHGKAVFQTGSFSTQEGHLTGQYVRGGTAASLSLQGDRTDRFLDPPIEENFTNKAFGSGFTARFERDLSNADRLSLSFGRSRASFLVPNELLQEEAGQRQDRSNEETRGQVSFQHIFSPHVMGVVHGMGQDLSSRLWSNPVAVPLLADQDRGFWEGYLSGTLSVHQGVHELKMGSELVITCIREQFAYQVTRLSFFDPDVPLIFTFADRRHGWEPSIYVQDLIRRGRWTLSAGLRLDHYRLLVEQSALSPRLGVAWFWPSMGMVFHASYDRAFQIPAIENLLLASSPAAQHLTRSTTGLPVPPSPGNFYQAGFSKSISDELRLDANYFRRDIRNFADDDIFLNTGVNFPIAFSKAQIYGFEGKLEMPRWGPFSGFLSYSNLVGTGFLPITGGLFLQPDSASLLRSTQSFPITQDQRNTLQGRLRFQVARRVWMALAAHYGSGLPVEGDFNLSELQQQFNERILQRVDFARGRMKPWYALDTSVGVDVWKHGYRCVRLQAEVSNFTNRFNVINFASLFSGTALSTPRAYAIRLHTEF